MQAKVGLIAYADRFGTGRDWLAEGEASPFAGMFLTYGTVFPAGAAANVDLYQVNCTFYDALGRDDPRHLLARALQFWTPGIPQVYYVGLLAGANDMDLLARTGVGRDVNRHHYTTAEINAGLARPVVQALTRLIRFRNTHPAFDGDLTCSGDASRIVMTRACAGHEAMLEADLATGSARVTWTEDGARRQASLASLP